MKTAYFIVICEEIDMLDGKIVHINQKSKNIKEACRIVELYANQFPAAHWELHPCHIQI